ncbi:HIT-like protein [Sodiomyces alkalinus F11]|uniref:Aprataxin-like protein n=1 Tax=Sodiomyces alkalinus (strain CBS 110278 / VKM F-3762 / F11) TaxID=1314773 RepID=A0A3N2Q273_SODAK|nr:HIT-like protein [Sodiomyces alkalinus F11]ROT40850.1 HIT-like protein [Sodiomyces alkalinus F11]
MKPKPKAEKPVASTSSSRSSRFSSIRDGLGLYLENPASHPSSRVIYYNDDFVAIHDLYPKSSVHTLLLPRSPKHNLLHPFEAFQDPEFLASVQQETRKLRDLVATELRRRFGQESATDALREAVLNGDAEPDEDVDGGGLPPGRDWASEVRAGIHAHPSMNHLHIHVFSRDMHSNCVKHRKHYNSFNTPFLIDVEDFPLAGNDPRLHPGREGYLKKDFICWRCKKNFKNQFQQLKAHLDVEFEEWKKE